MLTEKKKTALIITLTVSALLINLIMLLGFILVDNEAFQFFNRLLYEIGLFRWGWFPALGLTGYALKETRGWKTVGKPTRVIIFLALLVMLAMALIWLFGLIIISQLPT